MNGHIFGRYLKLSWSEAAVLIGNVVTEVTGRKTAFEARREDYGYWSAASADTKFSLTELQALLRFVNADADTRDETLPEDSDSSASVGMALSRKLLEKALGMAWEDEHITESALWLLNIAYRKEH